MLQHFMIAIGGVSGLMLVWLAVQNLKRRSDPDMRDGEDVLFCGTCSAHSCGGCLLGHTDAANAGQTNRPGGIS